MRHRRERVKSMHRWIIIGMLGLAVAGPVLAGPIEDRFREFIDRLRAQGQTIGESMLGDRWQAVRTPVLERRVDALPLGRGMYAVFVVPGCSDCREAVEHLRKGGRVVEVLDLSSSKTAREAYKLADGQGLPLLLIGNQKLTGWNKRLFEQAVRRSITDESDAQRGTGA
jgi:hypothetical protein